MQSELNHNRALGTVIARLRRRLNWTQEHLAFEAGVSRTYISLLERGLRSPTLDSLMQLCQAFEMDFEVLAASLMKEIKAQQSGEAK